MKKIKQAFVRIVRILLMTAIASAAFAQQQIAPRPAPDKPAVPRPAPAQSAQSQASPPAVVPQSTTATYADWIVQCQNQAGPPAEKICDMAQVTQVQGRNMDAPPQHARTALPIFVMLTVDPLPPPPPFPPKPSATAAPFNDSAPAPAKPPMPPPPPID